MSINPNHLIGQLISSAILQNNELILNLNSKNYSIYDDARHCCESRWMTCDDDPNDLVGGTFLGIEEKGTGGRDGNPSWMIEDTMFIEVKSSLGSITLCTHNEHNGYYGGFSVVMKEI